MIEGYGVTPEIEDYLPEDDDDRLVILRATKVGDEIVGKEIEYEDTPETLRMKENPLRETLIKQTGRTELNRTRYLKQMDGRAIDLLIHRWAPKEDYDAGF
jgi:hypothetical protein